jgi:hypothetical protein
MVITAEHHDLEIQIQELSIPESLPEVKQTVP